MISSIRGKITAKSTEYAIVEVSGIGLKVFASANTLKNIGDIGDLVTLVTHLHVREDALALYGFQTDEEHRMFELLLNVSGVGPKAALNILSAAPLEDLYNAIALGKADVLTRIPGIGAKTAARIVLELKGKIDLQYAAERLPQQINDNADVITALTNLGYGLAEAQAAIRSIPIDSTLSTEDKIVFALRYFAGQRGY